MVFSTDQAMPFCLELSLLRPGLHCCTDRQTLIISYIRATPPKLNSWIRHCNRPDANSFFSVKLWKWTERC